MPDAPSSYEVEAMLLDREDKRDEAIAAFTKAESLNSTNFFVHYRLASLQWPEKPDSDAIALLEKRLRRAVALNAGYAPAVASLADALRLRGQHPEAHQFAQRAVALEPSNPSHRLRLSRVLTSLAKRDEALIQAQAALALARTDEERAEAQKAVEGFKP
jgi:tetratricopeptide (TPR) repeat protein